MSPLPEALTLGPKEEAARLWEGSCRQRRRADNDLVALCEALNLGVRAAEILAVTRLQPVRESFPATIGLLLESPREEVDPVEDAMTVPRTLTFTDILDLLSDKPLSCVGPALHRGWEDRRFSCRRSRATAHEAIGFTLSEESRAPLLRLSAYRNRVFRCPPPVRIVPSEIESGFGELAELVERLLRG